MTIMTLTAPSTPTRRAPARPSQWRPPHPVRGCTADEARGPDRRVAPASTGRALSPALARPTRLTRRGRAVLALAFLACVGGGVAAGQATVRSADESPAYTSVVVEPGQTLWEIAVQSAPGVDPRATVERLVAVNGLVDADSITAGERLSVPVTG